MQLLNSLLLLLSRHGTIMINDHYLDYNDHDQKPDHDHHDKMMRVTNTFDDKAATAVLFASRVEIHFHRGQQDDHPQDDHPQGDHPQGDHRQDGDHEVEDETGDLSCNRSHELVLA